MLSLIPLRLYIFGGIVVALCVLGGVQTFRLAQERGAHQRTKAAHAEQLSKQERATRAASEAERLKESARVIALERVIHEQSASIESAQSDAVAARRAASGLRDKVNRLAATAGSCSPNTGPSTASHATDSAAVVLADVLVRIDERAGELAEFATRAHLAGKICEASYDAMRGQHEGN